jgi:hypothetical protein
LGKHLQFEADSSDGDQSAETGWSAIQLFPERMNVNVQNVGSDGKTGPPDASEQLISSAHGGIRLHQGLEDGEGFGRKSNRLPRDSEVVRVRVQLDGSNPVKASTGKVPSPPP